MPQKARKVKHIMIAKHKFRLEIYLAFTVTIVHTAVWIPLAMIHEKYIPKFSFEELLRIYS